MLEKDIENLIAQYPEDFFPNSGFKLIGQQVKIGSCFADIVFEDKYNRTIIVEVKRGILSRDASGQIIEYYGLLKQQNPHKTIELLLCANIIPSERKLFLENVGIECKELGLAFISNLAQKHNYKFLDDVEQTQPKESKVEEKPVTLSKDRNIWIFQANPDKYDILNALTDPNCNIDGWSIFQYKDKIKIGDIALIWMSGKDAGIYAIAEVISEPFFNSNPAGPDKYRIDEKKFMKERWMAKIKIIKKLINNPILRKELKNIEGLRNLSILRRPEGTNFPVTNSEWEIIKQKIGNPFLILPEKKMAFLLATDSWKKMDIYEDFISEHDKFVWRMGGVYSTQYLEQIRYPINVYFFHRNIVKFRCKCEEIGEIGHNRERFLEDIPIVFHSDNASYSTFLLFTELERILEVHISKFPKWETPKEYFTRGNLGLLRVVDIQQRGEVIKREIDEIPAHFISKQEAKTIISTHMRKFDKTSLGLLWGQASLFGPDMKNLKFLKYHLDFCKQLTYKILALSNNISVRVDRSQFSFDDGIGVGPFFSIFPQKSKLTIAPLRLTPKDLLDIDCPFRDITGKKYTMGGLVRVACHKCDEADLGMAFDLAKKSFEIKKKVGPAAFFGDDKGE